MKLHALRLITRACAALSFAACGGNGGGGSAPVPPTSAPSPTPAPNPPGLYVTYLDNSIVCAQYFAFPVTSSSKPLASMAPAACGFSGSGGTNGAGFGRDGVLYLNSGRGILKVTGGLTGNVTMLNDNWYLAGPISEDADGLLYAVDGGPHGDVYTMSAKVPSIVGTYSAPGRWGQAALVIGNTLYYTDQVNVYAYPLPLSSSGSLSGTPVLTFGLVANVTSLAADGHGNLYVLSPTSVSEYSTPLVANEQPSFVYPDGGQAIAVDASGSLFIAKYSFIAPPTSELEIFASHTTVPVQTLGLPRLVDTLATPP